MPSTAGYDSHDLEPVAWLEMARGKLGRDHCFAIVLDHYTPWQKLLGY